MGLFDPTLLLFTIPLLFSFALGALSLLGIFDLEALDVDVDGDADVGGPDADFDADADADANSGGGGVLSLLGLGLIPLSLFLVIFCFSFGWIGLLLINLFGTGVASVVGTGGVVSLVLALPAFAGAAVVTGPTARLLQPLFQDYGEAKGAHELVGSVGVLSTGKVTPTFGSASVTLPGRGRIEVSVRADEDDADDDVGYGDRVLLYDYDPKKNVYLVAPISDDELQDPA